MGCSTFLPLLLLLSSVRSSPPYRSTRHDLTFHLESRLTCFWETFTSGEKLRVSVVGGEGSRQLLQLRVTSPTGDLSDWMSGETSARGLFNLTETGVHEICVHSSVPTRVTLSIFAYDESRIVEVVRSYSDVKKTGDSIGRSVAVLQEKLYETVHSVKYTTIAMGRDERLQKNNFLFVTRYTVAFVFLNLVVAFVQVVFIRQLFRDANPGKIRI